MVHCQGSTSFMERTHAWLEQLVPGRHTLDTIPGYGHLDMFLGRKASEEAFPKLLTALGRG